MADFMNNTHKFEDCRDADAANNTITKFTSTIFNKGRANWLRSCPVPCQQKVYDVKVQQFHSNSIHVKSDPKTVYLYLYYDSFVIEESVESLVYGVGSFLVYGVGSFLVSGLKFNNHFTI